MFFTVIKNYEDFVNYTNINYFKHTPCKLLAEYYLVILCGKNYGEFLILRNNLLCNF